MEEEVSGLQEAGDMVEGEVREAEEDLRALTVLLEHAKREEDGIKRALYHTCRRGGYCFVGPKQKKPLHF